MTSDREQDAESASADDTGTTSEVDSDHDQQQADREGVRPGNVRGSDRRSPEAAGDPPRSRDPEHSGAELEQRRQVLDPFDEDDDSAPGEYQPELIHVEYGEKTTGNIPPPMMLRGYRDLSPKYADDIMEMAVEDSRSRNTVRLQTSKAESLAVTLGSIAGSVLPIMGLIAAFICIMTGHPVGAILTFIPAATAAIAKIISAARGTSGG